MSSRRGDVRRMPTSGYDALAEVALVAYSVAIVFSFSRLFIDDSYFVSVSAAAVSAHVLAAAVRWARGGLIVSTIVSAIGLLVSAALLFPPTTVVEPDRFIDRTVIDGFQTDLELAWDQFQQVAAPAEVTAPFLLMIAIVMWVVAFLSDWAAFRLRAPAEALIPGAAVFVFGALFAAEQNRVITAVVAVGAGLLVVLVHRLGETSRAGAWLGAGAAQRAQGSHLRSGLAILTCTLIGGVVLAQLLPGYDEDPVYDISELDATDEPRVVLSPLVDIRSRLIDQPDVEVFTVESETKDYWRITSLDVFDGRIWRSRGSFDDASGALETDLPRGTSFTSATQTFSVQALGGIWLPAAYEPAEVLASPPDVGFEYERESGTLIVDRDASDSDGLTYTVLSAVPVRDPDTIAAAGESIPADIRDRYLELPGNFSDDVVAEAERVVASVGAVTPYEKALALQNYFRDPNLFEYNLNVANGHSSERLEDFLFEVRVGYCEQFSGAYAAMARAIGLPARVAVGFTPGEFDPQINAYRVTGKHAHAWPEVWIDGIGWLRFEPTPGRGAPGDEIYTGAPEAQASDLPGNAPTTVAPANGNSDSPPTTASGGGFVPESSTTRAPVSDRAESGVIGGEDQGITARTVSLWALGLLAALALAVLPLAYGIWRAGRARAAVAHDPRRRIGLAWRESRAALTLMGVAPEAAETPRELVSRVRDAQPGVADVVAELAERVTSVTYAPDTVPESDAVRAELLTAKLAARARSRAGEAEWWWTHASPLNVWRDRVGTWGHLRV